MPEVLGVEAKGDRVLRAEPEFGDSPTSSLPRKRKNRYHRETFEVDRGMRVALR
jgi:hypothetical protein